MIFGVYASIMNEEYLTLEQWVELSKHKEFWDYLYNHNFYAANKYINQLFSREDDRPINVLLNLFDRDFYDKKSNNVIVYHNNKPHGIFYSKWLKELRINAAASKMVCVQAAQSAERKLLKPKSKKQRIKKNKRELSLTLGRNTSSRYGDKFFKPPGGKISDGVIFTPKEKS